MRGIAKKIALSVGMAVLLSLALTTPSHAQMCVKYARALTDFTIRGDAWTWWQSAAGRYERNARPAVGSVLVFKRTPMIPQGHVSVVSAVANSRVIRVDHSWVNGQGLVRGMRVVDISPNNDWTHVRVWHPPTDNLGMRTYNTFGFIHPRPDRSRPQHAALDDGLIDAVRSPNAAEPERSWVAEAAERSLRTDRRSGPRLALTRSVDRNTDMVQPRRKPAVDDAADTDTPVRARLIHVNAPAPATHAQTAPAQTTPAQTTEAPDTALPRRKPAAIAQSDDAPEAAPVPPRRKPGQRSEQVASAAGRHHHQIETD